MNKERLNELMAREIMGWIKGHKSSANDGWWVSWQYDSGVGISQRAIEVADWNPIDNINQAMICAEKASARIGLLCTYYKEGNKKWEVERNGSPYPIKYKDGMMLRQWYSIGELPKTICEAIAESIGDKK